MRELGGGEGLFEKGLDGGRGYGREVAVRIDAFRVVDYYLLDLCAGPEEEAADWAEDYADGEEEGKNCLGCEDGSVATYG